jgi:tRNA (guanine-N7-)-methyltransferase
LTIEELAPYLLAIPENPVPLDFPSLFGNQNPVEIEVGFGKGLFLVTTAQANPNRNYLGIEIARKHQLYTATRLAKRSLGNVRVGQADARAFFRDRLLDGSLDGVHVYFPDPWWKTRHVKRRVFTEEFAGACQRVLRPGGLLHIATDVEAYFRVMLEHLARQTGLHPLTLPEADEPRHDLDFLTNFERKSRKAGRAIYRGLYERLAQAATSPDNPGTLPPKK